MKQEEIKLIAEFDGWVNTNHIHPYDSSKGNLYRKKGIMGDWWLEKFKYETSYDWIMPILERIESLGFETEILYYELVENGKTTWVNRSKIYRQNVELIMADGKTKIKSVGLCVIKFVEWHNQQSKTAKP